MRLVACLMTLLLLSACSLQKHVHATQMQVAHFHALLNAGNFDKIVEEAGPGFKWPARGPTFKEYLAAVHRKLGYCGSWRMTGYNEHLGTGGGIVRISADTHCDTDNAQENFVFGTDHRLRGYTISSRALVVS